MTELPDGGGATVPAMDQLLAEFASRNPSLAWLPQMLAARRAGAIDEPAADDPRQDEIDALQAELALAQRHAARMERAARRLSGELEAAQSRLSDLAVAFGACGLCWGEDPLCPGCRGHGRPGRFAPDPELLRRFGVEAARRPQPAAAGDAAPSPSAAP